MYFIHYVIKTMQMQQGHWRQRPKMLTSVKGWYICGYKKTEFFCGMCLTLTKDCRASLYIILQPNLSKQHDAQQGGGKGAFFPFKQSSATPKLKNNPQKNYSSEKKFYLESNIILFHISSFFFNGDNRWHPTSGTC